MTKKVLAELLVARRHPRVENTDGWVTTVFVSGARYVGTLPIDTCTYGETWLEFGKISARQRP